MNLLLEASILFLKLVISEQELLKLGVEELQGSLILVDDGDIDLVRGSRLLLVLIAGVGDGIGVLQSSLQLGLR